MHAARQRNQHGSSRHERLPASDYDHALREALDARAFWRHAVLADPEEGRAILDTRARVLAINEVAGEVLLGERAEPMVGLTLHDLLPPAMASERVRLLRDVLRSERPILINSVWRGVRCRERLQLLPGDAGLAGQVLWMVRRDPIPWPQPRDRSIIIHESAARDWGPLAALTGEERQMLGMIGAGLGSEEISTRTGRPAREIARERALIRRKLGGVTTAALVRMALLAGLVPPGEPADPPTP
jgi:DNA-binding CsgD family transcriptional regulator